jgi:cyclophilin family peptidyl-prolyl cis-trans isomerase
MALLAHLLLCVTTRVDVNQMLLRVSNLADGSAGTVEVQLMPEWAPNGVAHLKELLKRGFYDGGLFYGADTKDGYAQFGLSTCGKAANTLLEAKPGGGCIKEVPADDAPTAPIIPNEAGTLIFSTDGDPAHRCIELCFNVKDHTQELAGQRSFVPLGKVTKGLSLLEKLRGTSCALCGALCAVALCGALCVRFLCFI